MLPQQIFVNLWDSWRQHENRFAGEDSQAGADLAEIRVENLDVERSACFRLRYRDRGLMWSAWSTPTLVDLDPQACP